MADHVNNSSGRHASWQQSSVSKQVAINGEGNTLQSGGRMRHFVVSAGAALAVCPPSLATSALQGISEVRRLLSSSHIGYGVVTCCHVAIAQGVERISSVSLFCNMSVAQNFGRTQDRSIVWRHLQKVRATKGQVQRSCLLNSGAERCAVMLTASLPSALNTVAAAENTEQNYRRCRSLPQSYHETD
jgi:hypothetical protein